MKTIEQYKKLKEEQKLHKDWYVKYGAKYYGGTSGKGEIGRLVYLSLSKIEREIPTIYYQYADGDKNYHKCPHSFLPYLAKAIKNNFSTILAEAIKLETEEIVKVAKEVRKEYDNILEDLKEEI